MAQLDGFEIDPGKRIVRAEPGALWGPIADAAGEAGLAVLHGSSRDVGVAGYTLGGGVGWLGRRYGLATNSVRAIELVTADGEHLRVDHENHPELFWGLRGGGGNFGVVTAVELELFPVETVYAGWLLWPVEMAAEVFRLYREWVENVPDTLTSIVRILHLPPLEMIPEPLRGKSWAVVEAAYLGDEAEGAELLRPLRAAAPVMDTFETIPASALGYLHADPPEPVPYAGHGVLIDDVTQEAIDSLVPENVEADVQAVLDAFERWSSRSYLNFKDRAGDASSAFTDDVYARLRDLKAAYDPEDLCRANHPIEPAA